MAKYIYGADEFKTKQEITTALDYTAIPGFDNTKHPITDYTGNNVFLGVPNVTQNTIGFMEPFVGGYGRVFCVLAPIFFPFELRMTLMRIVERFCKGLSGLANYDLQTIEVPYGHNAEPMTIPTNIKKGNNTFNLRFTEIQGSMVRKLIKYWVTGISDLGTGYGIYHGRVFTEKLRFSAVNHTAVILYCLTDNSGGAYGLDSVEFACIWYAVFPNTVPNSHLEWSIGEHSQADLDIPFFGIYHENNTVNSFAAEMLKKSNFYKDNYHQFNLGNIVYEAFDKRLEKNSGYENFEPLQKDAGQFSDIVNIDAGLTNVDTAPEEQA